MEDGLDDHIDDFEASILEQAEKRHAQDYIDYHNELSGNEVGRIARFLSADARALLIEKRTGRNPNGLSALDMMLLSSPEYAQAYQSTMNALEEAESATERALDKLESKLVNAKTSLQSTLDNAAELADGTKVFLDKDNKFRKINGDILDDGLATQIELQGNELSYETYADQKKSVQAIEDTIYEVRIYQTDVLGNASAELRDSNAQPKTLDEIEAVRLEIADQMPDAVLLELQQSEVSQKPSNNSAFTIAEPNL